MRRHVLGLLAVAVALMTAPYAQAYNPPAPAPGSGINGTVHDLGTAHNGMNYVAIPADAQARICIFCHAPHNTWRPSVLNGGTGVGAGPEAPDAFDYLPLWNHELTGNFVYSMYWNGPGAPQTGPRASQAIQQAPVLGSTSLLCMSCHDGSVAINSYGNPDQPPTSQSGGGGVINNSYVVGLNNDLQNHHPIGFDYDVVQAVDTEIRSADTAYLGVVGAGSLVRDHLYSNSAIASTASMECGTCHSVHNKGNSGESLLWRSDTDSRLCLTCHDKGTDPGTIFP